MPKKKRTKKQVSSSDQKGQNKANPHKSNNEAYQQNLNTIKEALNSWNTNDILRQHEIGQIINKMLSSPREYGSNVIDNLVRDTGYEKAWFFSAEKVANAWSYSQLERLITRKTQKNGLSLSWSHMAVIANLADQTEREQWIQKALANDLSARQLELKLNTVGKKAESGSSTPKDSYSGIGVVRTITETILKHQIALTDASSRNHDPDNLSNEEIIHANKILIDARKAAEILRNAVDVLSQLVETGSQKTTKGTKLRTIQDQVSKDHVSQINEKLRCNLKNSLDNHLDERIDDTLLDEILLLFETWAHRFTEPNLPNATRIDQPEANE